MKKPSIPPFAPEFFRLPHLSQSPFLRSLLAFAIIATAVPAWAENNSTNLFDGTTTNFGGAYFLPNASPGTNDYLLILNGGAVTNTGGNIGNGGSDNNNFAIIDGVNSIWENTGNLTIGASGSGNQMIVTNGGRVDSALGRLGNAGSSNLAIITGNNSLWNMSGDFQVGDSGKNNQLTIANGGRVVDTIGYIGSINSSNATVLVTGPGSVWSNTSTLNAGYAGNYARLIITNDGLVYNGAGIIGAFNGASNNSVIVTGIGSIWRNIGSLTLGSANNAGNGQLTISDGAQVINTAGNIGSASSSGNNLVTVTGAGSVWSNTSTLAVGGSGANNRLILTNGASAVVGGVITVGNDGASNQLIVAGGSLISAGATIGSTTLGNNNAVTVSGSTWGNNGTFNIGQNGSLNQVTVSGGATVVTTNGTTTIGLNAGSGNNALTVSGAGTVWTNGSDMIVGGSGSGNQLVVTNSATLYSGTVKIGSTTSSSNNLAVVSGGTWNYASAGSFAVGYDGASNQLLVSNGGQLIGGSSATVYIGGDLGLGRNLATVDGNGSRWDTAGAQLDLGWNSGENTLIITNGGNVKSGGFVLSATAGSQPSRSNQVVITGAGSSLSNATGSILVGSANGFNQMTVSAGARVVNSGGVTIGSAVASSNNIVTIAGGSVWTNAGGVDVGSSGGGNQIIITNNSQLFSGTARIGVISSSGNNQVVISGPGSLWNYTSGGFFEVGGDSASNQLLVADGGQLIGNTIAYIGGNIGGGRNTVTVSGNGSRWDTGSSGQLNMGWNSSENQLVVTNGGSVTVNGLVLSANASFQLSLSNRVVVTGANSTLTNASGGIIVGSVNGFNQLTVSDGGQIVNIGTGSIGPTTGTNIVTVTGPNSVWSNTSTLTVGTSGSGNQLVVSNGGKVYSGLGRVAFSGNDNVAIITGSNSLWKMSADFQVGDSGRNNQVIVSDGGQVNTTTAYIGSTSSQSNFVLITGAGSLWDVNNNVFYAGYAGSAGFLTISNGGRLVAFQTRVGAFSAASTNHLTVVTGPGSILQNGDGLFVGNNGTTLGGGNVLVTDGGTIEGQRLFSGTGGSGNITNRGGIYQFTTATPTVAANTAGSILITNGAISYRAVATANIFDPQVANMVFQGNNTFQLNNASNATGLAAYKFDSVANTGTPTNYQRLALVNTGSVWRSSALTIGAGGALLASNATATVAANLVSSGSVHVVNSTITYASNVVIHGSYVSDPSTNTFLDGVTIGQSGSLAGGAGDLFDFKKSLFINSTNNSAFNLRASAVEFSGGGMHTNAITGTDFGTNDVGYINNFAYGELHLGSVTDQVCFTCGILPPPAVTNNGLYVGWLDLLGNAALVTNLHAASGINLYYDKTDTRNAYLGGLTYGLTDCSFNPGGGSLIALIPEPSAMMLVTLGALGLLARRRGDR